MHQQVFCLLRIKKDLLINEYLFYFLISEKVQEYILPFIKGAQYPAISDKDLLSIEIPFLSIKEQEKTVSRIKSVFDVSNSLVETQTKKLNHLKALKSSLLDQAFKGQLIKSEETQTTQLEKDTVIKEVLNTINYDYEVATIVYLTWKVLKMNYGKKYIHKMLSNIQFLEDLPVFEDLEFEENAWGMHCTFLEKTIQNQKFINFNEITDDRSVLNFNYKHLKAVTDWMTLDDYNKDFVIKVEKMLAIYQKPLIDKNMNRIELFNTVLECMHVLETDNFDKIWQKMKLWKMFEDDFKNKAEKFKPEETKLMIKLIKEVNW
ncbi:restriction endonuclease subunit S [Algibacter sp. 2305UL17-15]|uniref:restriction endonuclease subunit S n=1 Tax=Algibacter sp. 2305UL17-15 TaxID=3231268 RepID=UPI003459E743